MDNQLQTRNVVDHFKLCLATPFKCVEKYCLRICPTLPSDLLSLVYVIILNSAINKKIEVNLLLRYC